MLGGSSIGSKLWMWERPKANAPGGALLHDSTLVDGSFGFQAEAVEGVGRWIKRQMRRHAANLWPMFETMA